MHRRLEKAAELFLAAAAVRVSREELESIIDEEREKSVLGS